MIQIYYNYDQNGPGKVIKNLLRGLEKCGETFELNTPPREGTNLLCLQDHHVLRTSFISNMIIGPNICTLPFDHSVVMEKKYKKIIVPSQWVKDLYKRWLPEDKISVWPVGVDTDEFPDKSGERKPNDCLLYVKRRDSADVEKIKSLLKEKKQKYAIITYGSYSESDFKDLISISKYGIVIDNCESQGLAIEEMMSSNLPLFVWDVNEWNDRGPEFTIPASSVPFWSSDCGIRIRQDYDLIPNFELFLESYQRFNPRKYILENLSLEKQARELLDLFS